MGVGWGWAACPRPPSAHSPSERGRAGLGPSATWTGGGSPRPDGISVQEAFRFPGLLGSFASNKNGLFVTNRGHVSRVSVA